MKRTIPHSPSNREPSEPKHPPLWLKRHYEEKRQRTVKLVKTAVDHLMSARQAVTIEAICRTSAALDPEGRGVKKSAVLENPEAHAYYRQHSASYQAAQTRKRQRTRKGKPMGLAAQPLRIDSERDVGRARYRYLQMTKPEIVERLLQVEHAYAESQERLARLQFEWAERQTEQGKKV
jgi:hypothetical protein